MKKGFNFQDLWLQWWQLPSSGVMACSTQTLYDSTTRTTWLICRRLLHWSPPVLDNWVLPAPHKGHSTFQNKTFITQFAFWNTLLTYRYHLRSITMISWKSSPKYFFSWCSMVVLLWPTLNCYDCLFSCLMASIALFNLYPCHSSPLDPVQIPQIFLYKTLVFPQNPSAFSCRL